MKKMLTRNMFFAVLLASVSAQTFAQDNHTRVTGHEKVVVNTHANQHVTVKPHQAWKAGSVVPSTYRTSSYRISHYQTYRLSKPAINQAWYKINGDYVLINVLNHHVIKIVQGK